MYLIRYYRAKISFFTNHVSGCLDCRTETSVALFCIEHVQRIQRRLLQLFGAAAPPIHEMWRHFLSLVEITYAIMNVFTVSGSCSKTRLDPGLDVTFKLQNRTRYVCTGSHYLSLSAPIDLSHKLNTLTIFFPSISACINCIFLLKKAPYRKYS